MVGSNGGNRLRCAGFRLDCRYRGSPRRVGQRVALQGNLDPCVLYATPERIRQEVSKVLAGFGQGNGHVFNLGHGIHPQINPDHTKVMVDAVHEISRAYHV